MDLPPIAPPSHGSLRLKNVKLGASMSFTEAEITTLHSILSLSALSQTPSLTVLRSKEFAKIFRKVLNMQKTLGVQRDTRARLKTSTATTTTEIVQ